MLPEAISNTEKLVTQLHLIFSNHFSVFGYLINTLGFDIVVHVIGLHAVQFGNNWMRKILRTAKIGRDCRRSPIWWSKEFF